MKKKTFHYLTNCVHSTAEKINAMTDQAREITYETFIAHVEISELQQTYPFTTYTYRGELRNPYTEELTSSLYLKRDRYVTFHKSVYDGQPCYYICHSGIEFIFVEQE